MIAHATLCVRLTANRCVGLWPRSNTATASTTQVHQKGILMYRCAIISLLLCTLLAATAAVAQAPPAADAFVASSNANTNYGSSAVLSVQPNVSTYIRFNLSGIPANATVQ